MTNLLEEIIDDLEVFIPEIVPVSMFLETKQGFIMFDGKYAVETLLDAYSKVKVLTENFDRNFLLKEQARLECSDEICRLRNSSAPEEHIRLANIPSLSNLAYSVLSLYEYDFDNLGQLCEDIVRVISPFIRSPSINYILYKYHESEVNSTNCIGNAELALSFLRSSNLHDELFEEEFNLSLLLMNLSDDPSDLENIERQMGCKSGINDDLYLHGEVCLRLGHFYLTNESQFADDRSNKYLHKAHSNFKSLVEDSDFINETDEFKVSILDAYGQSCRGVSEFRDGASRINMLNEGLIAYKKIVDFSEDAHWLEDLAEIYLDLANQTKDFAYRQKAKSCYNIGLDKSTHQFEKEYYGYKIDQLDSEGNQL